ncbi:MAG: iron chelate uptake ABC transporter family permease subunit [Thalassovita sp.]
MKRIWHSYLITALTLLVLMLISVSIGVADFRLDRIFSDSDTLHLLFLSRLPRTFAALLCGAAMAVAGVLMQLLARNRFVEPGTTGTTEGAILGLLLVTLVAPQAALLMKMSVATVVAMLTMLGFLALAQRLPPEQPLMLPLVGLIYSGLIGAIATYFAYQSDLLQYLSIWVSGGFSGVLAGRYELLWLSGGAALLAYVAADQFTVAGLGRGAATALGLRYGQVLALGVVTVAFVTALVVVTVGALPFVGLVVPNIVSRLMGDNLRQSLPVVAGMGAGLVLASDILGRIVRYPYEIPAGTVFGVIGTVVFLWLLYRRGPHV